MAHLFNGGTIPTLSTTDIAGNAIPDIDGNYPIGAYIGQGLYTGHIGAFYFGPVDETVIPGILEVSVVLLQPTVSTVENQSSAPQIPYIPVYVKLLQPSVYSYSDIDVDFVGVPRAGVSPLTVDFTATVKLSPENLGIYKVKEYQWCFDYNYSTNSCNIPWVTSTSNKITYTYSGYKGQKYAVKLCAILEEINE